MSTAPYSNAIPMVVISLSGASITGTYALVGTFTSWAQLMTIVSNVDAEVILSFDAVNDHVVVPQGDTVPACIPLNFKNNHMTMPKTSVFAKSAGSPSTGTLSVSAFTSQFN